MTRTMTYAVVLIALAAGAPPALGHGFLVSIDGNNALQLTSEDGTAGGLLMYKVQTLNPAGVSAVKSTDHPGFEAASGFLGNEQVYFEVLGPLWFSSGGAPTEAATGVSLELMPQDLTVPGSTTVDGTTGPQSGFLIGEYKVYEGGGAATLGAYEHQLNYEIDASPSVPIGAFAFAMRLIGINSVGQPFIPSTPFVAVFNNGLSLTTLNTISPQLFSVAVPEPSGWALAAVGAVGLLAFARRSQGSRRGLCPIDERG